MRLVTMSHDPGRGRVEVAAPQLQRRRWSCSAGPGRFRCRWRATDAAGPGHSAPRRWLERRPLVFGRTRQIALLRHYRQAPILLDGPGWPPPADHGASSPHNADRLLILPSILRGRVAAGQRRRINANRREIILGRGVGFPAHKLSREEPACHGIRDDIFPPRSHRTPST